jgi:hypothetical protein
MTNIELVRKLYKLEVEPTGNRDTNDISYCQLTIFNEETLKKVHFRPSVDFGTNAKAKYDPETKTISILETYDYKGFALLHEIAHKIREVLGYNNFLYSLNAHNRICEELIADLSAFRICLEFGIAFDKEYFPKRINQLMDVFGLKFYEIEDFLCFAEKIDVQVDKAVNSMHYIINDNISKNN